MASFQAIETISEVLVRLLKASHDPADFGKKEEKRLDFAVYQGDDFGSGDGSSLSPGVSLFLYRVVANGSPRTPPGRRLPSGEQKKTELPLDLHYLVTVWASSASMQHRIAGWLMRTLETTPILPEGVLHGVDEKAFNRDETVEIILNDLTNEDLFRIWDIIGESYRLSIPYLVRNVRIETDETVVSGEPVERRLFDVLQGSDNGAA